MNVNFYFHTICKGKIDGYNVIGICLDDFPSVSQALQANNSETTIPAKTHSTSVTRRKTSDVSRFTDILQNTSPVILKTVRVIKNKESLRNCHNKEEPKETQVNVMWCPEWGPGTKKNINGSLIVTNTPY